MNEQGILRRSVEEWQTAIACWPPLVVGTINELGNLSPDQYQEALRGIEKRKMHDKPHAIVWENFSPIFTALCQASNEDVLKNVLLAISLNQQAA